MTRRELGRFLRENLGQRVCIAYRTTRDGMIVLRPEPRALGMVLVGLGLAACTGYAPEIEHPDERCRDASGYEIDCRVARSGDVLLVPDANGERSIDHESHDLSRVDDGRDRKDDEAAPEASTRAPMIPIEGARAVPPSRPREVEGHGHTLEAGDYRGYRGGIVLGAAVIDPDHLEFVPTSEVFAELRERAVERREQRDARRLARRERRSARAR